MRLHSNLFIKMFTAFWLVTMTILGSWMLASSYFESRLPVELEQRPPRAGDSHRRPALPHRFLLRTIYELQNLQDHELRDAVAQARKDYGVEIFLLDRSGADLLGHDVPAEAVRAAQQLQSGRRRASLHTPRGRVVAHNIYRQEQGTLRAVFMLPPHKATLLNTLGGKPWQRVSLAVVVSGLVCFGLSRLLTNRLKELRLASRRLASGELDTRLKVRQRGGDETDELARDFNSMAEQLEQRIQAQKRLLGDVSHELRSPLARLRIALALAEQDRDNSNAHLERIEKEAERLEQLISQLLSSQVRDIPMDSHIDLVPLLQQLCADASFEGRSQGKTVQFHTQQSQALVDSSGDLLHKVFDNVLRNAISHTAGDLPVAVTLSCGEHSYQVTIEDRGPGVPEQDLENIFSEFFRVDSARSREAGGHGLGLAIARRAVLQHGGSIEAANTGSGLRINVSLPIPCP